VVVCVNVRVWLRASVRVYVCERHLVMCASSRTLFVRVRVRVHVHVRVRVRVRD